MQKQYARGRNFPKYNLIPESEILAWLRLRATLWFSNEKVVNRLNIFVLPTFLPGERVLNLLINCSQSLTWNASLPIGNVTLCSLPTLTSCHKKRKQYPEKSGNPKDLKMDNSLIFISNQRIPGFGHYNPD